MAAKDEVQAVEQMTPDEMKIFIGLKNEEVSSLTEEVKSLQKQLTDKENELAGVYQTNAALQEEIEKFTKTPAATNAAPATDTAFKNTQFELDGEKYGFHFPATKYLGKLINHVEIAADETLQRALVKIKAGILKKIDKNL